MTSKSIFDITGKVALVTGASSGLGRSIAAVLAEYGADVACVGRDKTTLAETVDLVQTYGHRTIAIQADVSDPQGVSAMVDETVRRLGKIDILFNNAGIAGKPHRAHETPIEDWDEVINVNLRGQFMVMKTVIGVMLQNQGGSIVNIASIAGIRAEDPAFVPIQYGVSKAGVICMTQQAAMQYVKDNIRINVIAPGMHDTHIGQVRGQPVPEGLDKIREEYLNRAVPMRRIASPDELKGLAILLASDASSYITGGVFIQDGGQTAKM